MGEGGAMPAYIIVNVHITDPARYEHYKTGAAKTVEDYGGRYLARGGETRILEGAPEIARLVILEFPSSARALAWWESKEYAPYRDIRWAAARSEMVLVEGVAAPQVR